MRECVAQLVDREGLQQIVVDATGNQVAVSRTSLTWPDAMTVPGLQTSASALMFNGHLTGRRTGLWGWQRRQWLKSRREDHLCGPSLATSHARPLPAAPYRLSSSQTKAVKGYADPLA
jgi:hypothetical protein